MSTIITPQALTSAAIKNAKQTVAKDNAQSELLKREAMSNLKVTNAIQQAHSELVEVFEDHKKKMNNFSVLYTKYLELLDIEKNRPLTSQESNNKNELASQLSVVQMQVDQSIKKLSSSQIQTTKATTDRENTANGAFSTASSAGNNGSASKMASKSGSNTEEEPKGSTEKKEVNLKTVPISNKILVLSVHRKDDPEKSAKQLSSFIRNNSSEVGYDINKREKGTNRTGLMLAAEAGLDLNIHILLSAKATHTLTDSKNDTALTIAIKELTDIIINTNNNDNKKKQVDYLNVIKWLVTETCQRMDYIPTIEKALKHIQQNNNENLKKIINDYILQSIQKPKIHQSRSKANSVVSSSASSSCSSSSSKPTASSASASGSGLASGLSPKPSPSAVATSVPNTRSHNGKDNATTNQTNLKTSTETLGINGTTPAVTTDNFASGNPLKRTATEAGLPTPPTYKPLAGTAMLEDENGINEKAKNTTSNSPTLNVAPLPSPIAKNPLPAVPVFASGNSDKNSVSSSNTRTFLEQPFGTESTSIASTTANATISSSTANAPVSSPCTLHTMPTPAASASASNNSSAASGSRVATVTSTIAISDTPKPIIFSPALTTFAEKARRLQELRLKREAEQNAVNHLLEQQRIKAERNAALAKQRAELEAKQAAEFAKQAAEYEKLESEFAEKAAERARLEKSVADMDAQNTEMDKQNTEIEAFLNSNATAAGSNSGAASACAEDIGQPSDAKKAKR